MPIASRIRLMIISALTNSSGRNGLIMRLLRLRDHATFAASARDVETHLFERAPAVADEQARRRVVVLDAPALHDDDALAQPLHLRHVVGGEQNGRAARLAKALEPGADPVGGVG